MSTVKKPPDLGPKLQRLRKQQGLTLEQLAERSNVSKSMLSQIERGQTNPTFATLWSLTRALNIEIADLVGQPKEDALSSVQMEHILSNMTPMMKSPDGCCLLRILSPVSTAGEIEWYELTFEPEGILDSQPHAAGTMEYLTCLSGSLHVTAGNTECRIEKGDSLHYPADIPHKICNLAGSGQAKALLVMIF